MMTAVVTLKIIKLFHFSDKTYLLLAAFAIFFPRNVQFSAMLNNDGLSFLFSMCALYYALKWWKGGKRFGWIILCALAVGLGMMTKFSSATVCLPIAGIFICEFLRTINKKENSLPFAKLFLQYAAFLCVCVPLGLWFQVYAKIRFDQGLGYVFDNLNRKLYTGDHSFFGRFFIAFDFSEYFGSIWCRPFEGNYNLFNYALRSAIFGEFTYWQGEGFAVLAIILAYLVSAILFISIIYCLVQTWKKKKEGPLWNRFKGQAVISFDDFLFLFLFMQSQALSEIYFYITMPYGCTMDFRYIMPIISAIALTIGFTQRGLEKVDGRGALLLNRLLTMTTVGFLLVSMLFYCVCI
jgi:4-amino-4-deoxy-L-arabinose transferase-like glycosyltransferase